MSSDDFISGLTMSELTDVTTLSADNNILVGTADGNRAMTASNLAKAVVSLLSAGDFIAGVKMADIPQVSVISAADRLLVGTAAGNKAINASDAFFSMLDTFIAPEQRRMTFRGKNLGGAVTTAQKAAIRDGSFISDGEKETYMINVENGGLSMTEINDVKGWLTEEDLSAINDVYEKLGKNEIALPEI